MVEIIRLSLISAMEKSDNVMGLHQYHLCAEELGLLSGESSRKPTGVQVFLCLSLTSFFNN